MNESTEDALVGRTIDGKFAIESLIGVGAMGAVYRARQIALDKVIAVKVMHPDRARDAMYAALFQRESRAASRLDHPNSVRVIDFGEDPDGLLYIAMEYFAGRDLLRVLAEDWPLSSTRIANILSQALAAIALAHDMGMVHRDLKPENILVQEGNDDEGTAHDIVKVCDFGIAKFTEPGEAPPIRGEQRLTEGVVIGTPHYMSPEQGQGETLDARSDLYSMGVILYQMLTARVPFDGKTLIDVVVKHVRDEPVPPTKHVPWTDARLEAICLKALKKKREERHQSAREMRADLRAVLAAPRPKTELPRPVSKSAPTLPPPDEPPNESADGPFESSPGKVTTASVTQTKGRRRGTGAALLLAMVITAGATLWMTRLSRTQLLIAKPASPATLVASGRHEPPGAVAANDRPTPVSTNSSNDYVPVATAAASTVLPSAFLPRGARPSERPIERPTVHVPDPSGEPAALSRLDIPGPPIPPLAAISAPSSFETHPLNHLPIMAVTPVPSPPFDPSLGRVTWSVQATGGGATATEVRRALGRVAGVWDSCYQEALRGGGQRVEGSALLRIATDEEGNVVQARVAGFSLPTVGPCIAASASVRIGGVDTGSAWADIKLAFRASARE